MRGLRAPLCLSLLAIAGCSGADDTAQPKPTSDAGTGDDAGPPPITKKPPTPVPPLFIGTGGFGYNAGSAFPGAAAPAGLAKVGPDTKGPWGTVSFLHFSGYWYGDDTIRGFSHLHLHGTGATDYGVLAVMPSDGFDASRTTAGGYESPFQKKSESANPGHYAVTLDRGNIAVDLTATPHAAHHRYTYPPGAAAANVIFDLDHHLDGGTISDASVTLLPAEQRISGKLHSIGGMSGGFGGYDVFFEIRAAKAWTDSQVWSNGAAPAQGTSATGTGVGFELAFDPAEPIEIAVGLSLVSADAAAANLAAEIPAPSTFEDTKKKTADTWTALIDRVQVTGGTPAQRDTMTAALYHAFLMPTVMSDVDGSYVAMDGQIRVADGYHYVSDMSLWDTYRTLHPFYDLVAHEYARDAVRSLHEQAIAGGFFPKWPIATGESGTMIGASAEIVVADAYIKGVTDFDAEGAYSILRAAAMDSIAPPGGRGGRNHVESYMTFGYVPAPTGGSVSLTTEYACEDFALGDLAAALGHDADAAALHARALGYRKLFDPETGFLWAKNEDGTFATYHVDPTLFADEFVEGNAWQGLWMVARDADGLAALFGGRAAAVAKLEELFAKTKEDWDLFDPEDTLKSAGPRPYFWAGNEPDINAPYLFAQLGRPDLTQQWVSWVRDNVFGPGAEGLPGNDDGGTLSTWWAFSALGFYPIAGSDRYIVGTPLFTHAELAVPGGTFTIDAPGASSESVYVQSAKLNGAPLDVAELTHADLAAGGKLEFVMGAKPSQWGKKD